MARDLRGAPFNYDSQTAFIVGNKLFYQGSGNIGAWHSCTCGVSSDGCGATNAYMQWLTADDDNGNLNDGTPHMTAIFTAFDRHGIACTTPTPQNAGCGGGPTAASDAHRHGGSFQTSLSWTAVAGATRYWVFRTEGHVGCDFGKALIAETTGLSYTDTQVANGRPYSYNVVAAGTSSACYGVVSNCATAGCQVANLELRKPVYQLDPDVRSLRHHLRRSQPHDRAHRQRDPARWSTDRAEIRLQGQVRSRLQSGCPLIGVATKIKTIYRNSEERP